MAGTDRIAIVDDDVAVREATSGLLRSLGYDTGTFGSVEHFLGSTLDSEWSCVITDLKMPGLSGLDLQAELLARRNNVPVIFMTAFPDLSIEARALAAGAHAFLTKPCRQDTLAECVRSALQRNAPDPD